MREKERKKGEKEKQWEREGNIEKEKVENVKTKRIERCKGGGNI